MARITIRNLDDWVIQRLRERGAARGVSMEQEVRDIFAAAVSACNHKGWNPGKEKTSLADENQGGSGLQSCGS